jgi:ADP-dependent NAD(P)H-hydrate dehydratase
VTPVEQLLEEHPLRAPAGSKDGRGSVLIIGGPPRCPGAVVLAAEACLRSGAGRVQLAVHPAVAAQVAVAVPESLALGWDPQEEPPSELTDLVGRADAVVIGSGYGDDLSAAAKSLASWVDGGSLVLDAGALAAGPSLAGGLPIVLAPNTDEATELAGAEGSEEELALTLGRELRRPVAVRGRVSTITDRGDEVWHHETNATGLGTPGSGDVLMGTLAALLARGVPATAALGWAVALHGRAGEIIERSTPVGYLARDLVRQIPAAFVELDAI